MSIPKYEIGIIGAGLAGLSLAIQLGRKGYSVALFEKSAFPFHKLCGEYLSRESVPFLKFLGINLESLKPAEIDHLLITNASGKKLEATLPLGGIGLSRWNMDYELYKLALEAGAVVYEKTPVRSTSFQNEKHLISSRNSAYECDLLISSFGKKSNLSGTNKLLSENGDNYIGIKYHAKYAEQPENRISIHNFKDGYCGVCRLEKDWVSVCYLSHSDNLKASGGSIEVMQENVLFKNGEIRKVFEKSEFLYERPITVSNISFKKKNLVKDEVMYVGDAAGLITPLCGNGMSMSLHGSYILGELVSRFMDGEIDKPLLFSLYQSSWDKEFKLRMATGRTIQKAFRKERTADLALAFLKTFPYFNRHIIKLTHGKPFGVERP